MAMSGAIKHVRNYASAGTLAALAGIISFPVLTRNLSVEDYGIVGLITASLTLFIAIGKLGLQHSVIRFFAQIKNRNFDYSLSQLNSTVSVMFFVFASITTILWLILGYAILPGVLPYDNISELFLAAAGVVFVRLLGSGVMNFMRALQRSAEVGISLVLTKYLYLALVLLILFSGLVNPYHVLICMSLAEIVGVGYIANKYWPDFEFRIKDICVPLGKLMLIYGMPLMMLESLGLILRLSDRYIIEALLGANALGMYSASYSLTAYIDIILLTALVQAIRPHYMQLWEGEGSQATTDFLSKGFYAYLIAGIPFIALFSLTIPHLLTLLAGPEYAPGTIIIPFVAFSILLDGAMHFLGAGLYIRKNTKILMFWGLIATVLNIVLNFLAVPVIGILGAAIVTVISYAVFLGGVAHKAFQSLSFDVELKVPLLVFAGSGVVYLFVSGLNFGGDFLNMLAKGMIATPLLVAVVVALDSRSRGWLGSHWSQRKHGAPR